jgi:hypothetical protein
MNHFINLTRMRKILTRPLLFRDMLFTQLLYNQGRNQKFFWVGANGRNFFLVRAK